MPDFMHPHYLNVPVAPDASISTYRTPIPQPYQFPRLSSPTVKRDTLTRQVRAEDSSFSSTTRCAATSTLAGIPIQVASALASWNIPPESWIRYVNGTYAWPTGLMVHDSPIWVQHPPIYSMPIRPRFYSGLATGMPHQIKCSRSSDHASSSFISSKQIRRAPHNRKSSLRDQYTSDVLQQQHLDEPVSGTSPSSATSSEGGACLLSSLHNSKSFYGKLTDLMAIVRYIVPAGGLDPNLDYGFFERLKYTPGDLDEGIEHFVRDAKTNDPDFFDKLTDFAGGRPGTFRGASPTEDFRRQDMMEWGYVCYEGEWIKEEDARVRRHEAREKPQQIISTSRSLRRISYETHPAQLEDELAYRIDYCHADSDDDYNGDAAPDFEGGFRLCKSLRGGKFGSRGDRKLLGTGTIRRKSCGTGKSKTESKQQKINQNSKSDKC
ncbi:hypothetical protein WAI453_012976 [Rhynchosporium graminicola]